MECLFENTAATVRNLAATHRIVHPRMLFLLGIRGIISKLQYTSIPNGWVMTLSESIDPTGEILKVTCVYNAGIYVRYYNTLTFHPSKKDDLIEK